MALIHVKQDFYSKTEHGNLAYALNCQLLFDNPTQLVEEIKAWLRLMELCIAAAHRTIYRITQFYGLIDSFNSTAITGNKPLEAVLQHYF